MDIVTQTCLLFVLVALIITIPVCAQRFHLVGESYLLAFSVLFLGVAYLLDWGIASPAKNYVLVIFSFQATFALALFVKKFLVVEWARKFVFTIERLGLYGRGTAYLEDFHFGNRVMFEKNYGRYVLFLAKIWIIDNNLYGEYEIELQQVPIGFLDNDYKGPDLFYLKSFEVIRND